MNEEQQRRGPLKRLERARARRTTFSTMNTSSAQIYFWQQQHIYLFTFSSLPIYLIFALFSFYCIDITYWYEIPYEPFQHSKNLTTMMMTIMMMMMKTISSAAWIVRYISNWPFIQSAQEIWDSNSFARELSWNETHSKMSKMSANSKNCHRNPN